MHIQINPGHLTLSDIKKLTLQDTTIELDKLCYDAINHSANTISEIINNDEVVYGINTGFGALANQKISTENLEDLQRRIVLSHAAGTGELLDNHIVRLMLALKINSLARGYSGIRLETLHLLIELYNHKIYPCIPSKGSVGASGDLAPLAHLSLALLGEGKVSHQDKIVDAKEALAACGLKPVNLAAKEGLALLNGTQASTAIALSALFKAENIFCSALVSGALSVDAASGSVTPFDERIHLLRGHQGQIDVAKHLRELLHGSEILQSHKNCEKVQDPYSLRCQPQVMGACLTQLDNAKTILLIEANAVSDNPLVFADQAEILSGGNFHAEPVAFAADNMAISIAEIGAIAERRCALLVDQHFSGLPAFLVKESGLNSGFMIAQVTAAALASENKRLAHPASVDSLPTSANQEDHVSMATSAACRLHTMLDNTYGIIAIELLSACQGIDLRRPLKTSKTLEAVHAALREKVEYYAQDRYFAPDIEASKNMLLDEEIKSIAAISVF